MAKLGTTFDPTQVEPDNGGSYEPIPRGFYVLQVTESDVVPTKAETGEILKITLEVYEGDYKGRKVFENINIINASPKAQEIGQKQLSALCAAMGHVGPVDDSQDLHYKPFEAEIGIEPERPNPSGGVYAARNKVLKYIHEGNAGTVPPPAKAAPRPAPAPAPAPAAGPAWKRRVA